MKQTRFQPLNETYQKLSTLLCKTALSIQTTNYTVTDEWTGLIQKVQKTCAAFRIHAEKQESRLFPLLHNYEPALVAILRDEQCDHLRYLSDLSKLFAANQAATNKHKSMLFSHKLLYRFNEFVASAVQQMKEHESMINEVLWRYFSDKELVAIAASLSITSSASLRKKDFTYADHVINNIVPPAATQPSYNRHVESNTYKPTRASKAMAIAI